MTVRQETTEALDRRTVADFGRQWTRYPDNSGYYGTLELLADILEPLLPVARLKGARVAEIGSGTGRIVSMLLDTGVQSVLAVEPSEAVSALVSNVGRRMDQVTVLRATGDCLPPTGEFDYVVSIGVIHHIADPRPTLAAAYDALKPGGELLIWVYGREGNELYLRTFGAIRSVTCRLPPAILAALGWMLLYPLNAYIALCRFLPLPMRGYVRSVLARFSRDKRRLVIYDQLNPAYARYYREQEARALLSDAGFRNVRSHHRHGYSWTVIGEKPA
jgi:SAM-dependent methyltransferase